MPEQDIQQVYNAGTRVLYRTTTVFPFTFFPHILEVTDNEVRIIYGIFINSKEVMHMPIAELHNVKLTTSLFFGRLSFEIKGFESNPRRLEYLPKNEAIEVEALISGLILCRNEGIDTTEYSRNELITRATRIGHPETANI